MLEEINKLILRHVQYLEQAKQLTCRILQLSSSGEKFDLVYDEIENRDRLLQIIRKTQGDIEEKIGELTPETITKGFLQMAKNWMADTEHWSREIGEMDGRIVEYLEKTKEETSKEIAQVFSNKNKFKGYNLNNVKK